MHWLEFLPKLLISCKPRMLLAPVLMLPLMLAGCVMTTGNAEIKAAVTLVPCTGFRKISWSSKDTDQTILEVKEHNAAYKAICGGNNATN